MLGMTGYSFKEFYYKEVYISTEIKSVNSRFLELNVYIPYHLNSIEMNIRELAKKKLNRGKIDISVTLKLNVKNYIDVDLQAAKQYYEGLNKLIDNFNLKDEIRLFHLTKYDDIISREKTTNTSEYWKYISKSLSENIEEILKMKEKEGDDVKKDLDLIIGKISKSVENISKRVPKMEKEIFNNLKVKVKELIGNKVDEVKLLNETAFLVSRSGINEELQRLKSHIEHFSSLADENNDVGKRLDFICQEMHREINTIGSKITKVELTTNVISIKNDIEKLREQIRNIE